MKDQARLQSVIEILEEVLKDAAPADQILDKYFKARRYIGAKDRRFIADSVWQIIRTRQHLSFALNNNATPRLLTALFFNKQDLALLFTGELYAPTPLNKEELATLAAAKKETGLPETVIYECPLWLLDKFTDKSLLNALNQTAPVDVRANLISREEAKEKLKKEGLFFSPTPFSPIGLRSEERVNFNNAMTYLDGYIEVMDEASQLIALLCQIKPHHKTIDYCAGAGGKSLAFASIMQNEGQIFAHDINLERLSRIKKRAERLMITNIKTVTALENACYGRFVIDAPCSGSGTWRRSPDAKYRLTKKKLEEIINTQQQLLDLGAAHTAPNGRLIYITCSVFKEENESQIAAFLARHPEFSPLDHQKLWRETLDIPLYPFESRDYLSFSPLNTKTDGFFFCALQKSL